MVVALEELSTSMSALRLDDWVFVLGDTIDVAIGRKRRRGEREGGEEEGEGKRERGGRKEKNNTHSTATHDTITHSMK